MIYDIIRYNVLECLHSSDSDSEQSKKSEGLCYAHAAFLHPVCFSILPWTASQHAFTRRRTGLDLRVLV